MLKNLCLVALLILAGPARARELSASDIDRLIARLQAFKREHPGVIARFREERFLKIRTQPLVLEGEVKLMAPDKLRREVSGPNPSQTISDGHTLWIYYPVFNEAERYALDRSHEIGMLFGTLNAGLNFQGLKDFFRIQGRKTDDSGYMLALEPLQPNIRRVIVCLTVWLDADLRATKTEYETPRGDRTVTTYTEVRLEPVPASEFQFTPPAGARVVRPLG
ncbi:MAG: outer membrane lipoprotein carrier protein LolA [Verrucomicrobiota bacterium]|nr:outer membrane lipoprotein carrier protein LolA [Verrucomicrobiota bacterium]